MNVLDLIKTSLYSIKAHKLRVFLTMLGIIIGISSTVTIKSIGDGLAEQIKDNITGSDSNKYEVDFISNSDNFNYYSVEYFNDNDVNELLDIDGVIKVESSKDDGMSGMTFDQISFFDKNNSTVLMQYSNKLDLVCGRWFNSGEEYKNCIVLDYTTAEKLFTNVEDAIGCGVSIKNNIYEVIGVLRESEGLFDSIVYGSSYLSEENMNTSISSDIILYLNIYIDPEFNAEDVNKEVVELLTNNHRELDGEYSISDPQEMVQYMMTIINGITTFVTFITGISLFVGGVGVMNIMYVSVSERKREIGIRRAIGAKSRSILLQFLFESIIVTFIGGVIGIVLGYIFGNLISNFIPLDNFKAVLTLKTLISSASISVIVGILFGIIPARNAANMDPIKAIYK